MVRIHLVHAAFTRKKEYSMQFLTEEKKKCVLEDVKIQFVNPICKRQPGRPFRSRDNIAEPSATPRIRLHLLRLIRHSDTKRHG